MLTISLLTTAKRTGRCLDEFLKEAIIEAEVEKVYAILRDLNQAREVEAVLGGEAGTPPAEVLS